MEIVYEKTLKLTQDLKADDEFKIGDVLVKILRIQTNDHDELVLHLDILGARFKKRSKMMLIIPKEIPIETLQ